MNNIILCGFMGCGKTTVGKRLAELLGRDFLDLDLYIEGRAGMTIPEIFASLGEAGFRRLEREAVASLASLSGVVVATGGGALASAENSAAIDRKAYRVVLLDVPFDCCLSRISGSDRPLVAGGSPDELRRRYDTRLSAYRAAADLIIPADREIEAICAEIISKCD